MRRCLISLACLGLAGLAVAAPSSGAKPAGPTYRVYAAPSNLGNDAGEPSLGVDPHSGQVLFQAGLQTLLVSNFDRTGPGTATWRDVSDLKTSLISLDPMLKMDPQTGRAFVSQLAGACSTMAYTDDRGETWNDLTMGCGVGAELDHQNIGFGPYVKGGPLANLPHTYPNVVYYCAQDVVTAKCAASVDGGVTFLPANAAYSVKDCQTGELFGHLKAAPDGTVYLPPNGCNDLLAGVRRAGVAVSEDNGVTWTMRLVPGSAYGDAGHGSVGVARDGTVYLAWGSGPGHGPVDVAVSHDKGRTWTKPVPLGGSFGIKSSRFPVAVAGDGDRAVVAYLGTPTAGDGGAAGFRGVWHLYASHTYDGGRTWTTVDVTPHAPVQFGAICTAGTTCGNDRNLLDFNDAVVDSRGHVYIAFADGCTSDDCTTRDRQAHATIARLVGGRGLYRAYGG